MLFPVTRICCTLIFTHGIKGHFNVKTDFCARSLTKSTMIVVQETDFYKLETFIILQMSEERHGSNTLFLSLSFHFGLHLANSPKWVSGHPVSPITNKAWEANFNEQLLVSVHYNNYYWISNWTRCIVACASWRLKGLRCHVDQRKLEITKDLEVILYAWITAVVPKKWRVCAFH